MIQGFHLFGFYLISKSQSEKIYEYIYQRLHMNKTPFLADNVRKMIHHSGHLYLEILLRATCSYLRDNVYFRIKSFWLHLIFTKLKCCRVQGYNQLAIFQFWANNSAVTINHHKIVVLNPTGSLLRNILLSDCIVAISVLWVFLKDFPSWDP